MNIEISKLSRRNPDKNKNGDYSEFRIIPEENLVVLSIADGVGSSPCDWKASQIGCQRFIAVFEEQSKKEISERIKYSLKKVNKEILLEGGSCENMKSTFCGVVWDFKKNHIYYTNIGDSRIYKFADNKLEQLSDDEVKAVILKRKDGKPVIISGTAVVAEGGTNVIGIKDLTFEVNVRKATNVQAIILTTDGFHRSLPNFNTEIVEVINFFDLNSALELFYQNNKDIQKDDMTILVARKRMESGKEIEIITSILSDGDLSNVSDLELAQAVIIGLENRIKEKDEFAAKKLLSIRAQKRIDYGKDKIGNLISLMIKVNFQNGEIYQELLKMIRTSKY